jgi:hypothetical protein
VIKELPGSRTPPVADQGVTHREISWRAAVLRRALPALVPPRWLDPIVVLLVVGYLLGGLAATPFTLQEKVQQSLTADAGTLLTHPQSLLPGDVVSAPQEAVRLGYGALTRYAAAVGWYAAGGRAAQVPIDLTGPSPVRTPDRDKIVASRVGPALLSAIGVLMIFVLTRRLLGRAAALAAVLIFGLHPTTVLVGRQAADAGPTMALGLATVLVAAAISGTLARGAPVRLGSWTGLSLIAGLTLASGATAPPYLAGAGSFVLAGLLGRQLCRRRAVLDGHALDDAQVPDVRGPAGWLAVTALGAVLVWVAVSPALWGWLPERLVARHQERPALIAKHLLPDPGAADPAARVRSGLGAVTDPFLTPPRSIQGTGLADYRQSWWSGLPLGEHGAAAAGPLTRVLPASPAGALALVLGSVLTLAAGLGAIQLYRTSRRLALAMLGWALATVGWLVLDPSTQADHATPLVALSCLLAAAAVPFGLSYLARLSRQSREAMDRRGSPDSLDFVGTEPPGSHRTRR